MGITNAFSLTKHGELTNGVWFPKKGSDTKYFIDNVPKQVLDALGFYNFKIMAKEIKNFIDVDIIDKFPSQYPNKSFFNYVSNLVGLESVFAVAGMLAPELVIENECIFLKENYPIIANNNLYHQYGKDIKTLERYVNLFCVSDFYLIGG